jgi:hypothetical protein
VILSIDVGLGWFGDILVGEELKLGMQFSRVRSMGYFCYFIVSI